ncbi:MAG: sulfotransferase [Candidatus Dormibacteraeota bacterium]|nr:sulfotransferase [Candidatus Dormibacteraeota bacterium]
MSSRLRPGRDIESRITWIFGSPRSGSTWLLALLAEHELVVAVNEPLIGSYLSPFMCDQPGFSAQDLDASNFTIRRVQRGQRQQFFADEFADTWLPGLGRLMRDRFSAHLRRDPKAVPYTNGRVVIKEPNGSESADVIMAALPRSRLLFLLRDGRDVVDSVLAANLSDSWVAHEFPGARGIDTAEHRDFVIESAHKWLWRTEVVQAAYAAHPGPRLMVRYEDLLQEPHRHLREICDWMELPVSDSQLEQWIGTHAFESLPAAARGPKQFFRAAQPGLWRKSLTLEEQVCVTEILGPKLRELGYAHDAEPV